jgi:hypothetical protein
VVIIGAALSLIGVVTTFGEFCYLRRFARRIPDLKLAKRTTVVMWGFGITAAVGALAALAGIILTLLGVGPFAPGGAFTVTASGASATATSNLAAGSGPTALLTGIGAAFVGCSIGLAFLVFFIFYVGLLIQYYGAFKQAVAEAEQIARGELPPFRFGEASPPGPAQHA